MNHKFISLESPQSSICDLDCAYCLAEGTEILLKNYTKKKIEDVKIGDEILAFEEYAKIKRKHRKIIPSKVVALFSRESETIQITTFSGFKIVTTKNHPFLSPRGSYNKKHSYREAGKFKVGQRVRIYPKIEYRAPDLSDINYKIGYFLAIMIGDGSCNKYPFKKYPHRFQYKTRLAMKDSEAINRSESFAKELGIELYVKPFRNYERALFANKKDTYDKIKKLIYDHMLKNNSKEYMSGFLAGIYDAEGHINSHGMIRITNTDLKIIEEIERCLASLNIRYVRETDYKGTKNHDIKYRVRTLNSPELGFIKFIKSVVPSITRKGIVNIYNNSAISSDRITSIEDSGTKKVYNFETTTHTYIANNFCVHNCYIPKNKSLKKIHKKWQKVFQSNRYYELVSEFYNRNDLEALSLWGGEPSMGFKDFEDIKSLFLTFSNLKSLSTSTNLVNINGWKYFIPAVDKALESLHKRISFDIQVSIDGTQENTDKNRGKNVFKRVHENLFRLADLIRKTKNIDFVIHSKPTNTDEDYEEFAKNKESVRAFVESMDGIDREIKEYSKSINNLQVSLFGLPSLALPGSYTKQDGINFYNYHLNLEEVLKDFSHLSWGDEYYYRWETLYKTSSLINTGNYNQMYSCSAGSMMQSIDGDGTMHGCHGSLWYNYQDYLTDSAALGEWTDGKRILNYEADKYWEMMRTYMASFRDKYNDARVKTVSEGFTYDIENKLNIALGTIQMLTIANQLNPIYKNKDWAKLFATFITLKSSCWMNNMIVTGSPAVTPTSIYKIYGNGTFEYIVRKFWEQNSA